MIVLGRDKENCTYCKASSHHLEHYGPIYETLGLDGHVFDFLCSLLNWRVPFLSWMAVLVFLGGTVLFYVVPIRYLILIWGINKYTKRLRKPNYISNNELLDFLSRCPTNKQLQQWQELSLAVYHRQQSNSKIQNKKSIRKTK